MTTPWLRASSPRFDQDGVSAFLHAIVLLPAQIVRTGRRVIDRIMSYNRWLKDLFAAWEHLRRFCAT